VALNHKAEITEGSDTACVWRNSRSRVVLLCLSGLLGMVYLAHTFDQDYLLRRQLQLQRLLCGPTVKKMFYDSGLVNTKGNILTDDQLCSHLPGFESRCIIVDFTNLQSYRDAMKGGQISYIFFPTDNSSAQVSSLITDAVSAGRYKIIVNGEDRILIRTGAGIL